MHWKEILPVDRYKVIQKITSAPIDISVLTLLYQPLVGAYATALYQTLLEQSRLPKTFSQVTHHFLMAVTGNNLEKIYQARKHLEGVGLLNVFEKEGSSPRQLIYELVPPLSPQHFFSDELLSHFLYNRIGPKAFKKMKATMTAEETVPETGFTEVTAAFNDVYESVKLSELAATENDTATVQPQQSSVPYRSTFDFQLLDQHLSDVIISKSALTAEMKATIEKLAFLYQLNPEEMSYIIQSAFLHNGELNSDELRRAVQKHYYLETGEERPALSDRVQPPQWREMEKKETMSDEDKQIAMFEEVSPFQLLETLAGGGKPPAADLRIIEGIMFDQKLPAGVVNVLIHYIMYTNDQKLVKAYVEKIAGHWARKQVKTVREAMTLARSEHKKYQSWNATKQRQKSRSSSRPNSYNSREERLPKWMQEEAKETKETTQTNQEENQKRKQWLEDYLNNI